MKEREDAELIHELQSYYQDSFGKVPSPEQTWQKLAPALRLQESRGTGLRALFQGKSPIVVSSPFPFPDKRRARLAPLFAASLVLLIIGLLLFASSGYADIGSGPLNDLFNQLGLKPIARQFTDYHQSKSIDGYTLTIQKVYADSNQVIVGFTGEVPAGGDLYAKFPFAECTLMTDQGLVLSGLGGTSNTGNISGTVLQFDAAGIQGAPKELKLELRVPYGFQRQSEPFTIRGYLTFDFVVPFHVAKIVPLNQAVTASGTPTTLHITEIDNNQRVQRSVQTLNGKTITLQKVVVSASETRMVLGGLTYEQVEAVQLEYTLTVGKQSYQWNEVYAGPRGWELYFEQSASAHTSGKWTLTIQQITLQADRGAVPVPGASWTFQFSMK